MLICTWIKPYLSFNRALIEVQLTPFWSPIKHFFLHGLISPCCSACCKGSWKFLFPCFFTRIGLILCKDISEVSSNRSLLWCKPVPLISRSNNCGKLPYRNLWYNISASHVIPSAMILFWSVPFLYASSIPRLHPWTWNCNVQTHNQTVWIGFRLILGSIPHRLFSLSLRSEVGLLFLSADSTRWGLYYRKSHRKSCSLVW